MSRRVVERKDVPQAEPMGVFQTRVHLDLCVCFPTALVHYYCCEQVCKFARASARPGALRVTTRVERDETSSRCRIVNLVENTFNVLLTI